MECVHNMYIGTIVPIPKEKHEVVCKTNNLRAIALSSIFVYFLDWIILIKEQKSLCTSNLQFGFKQSVSAHDSEND